MKKQFSWYQVHQKQSFFYYYTKPKGFLLSSKTLFYSQEIQMKVVLYTILFYFFVLFCFVVVCLDFIKICSFFSFVYLIGHVFVAALTKLQFSFIGHLLKEFFSPVVYIKTAVSPRFIQSNAYIHEMPIEDPSLSIL